MSVKDTMAISIIGVVILFVLLVVFGYFKYSFQYWKKRGVPCDEPSVPSGNLRGLGTTLELYEILKKTYDKFKETGAKFCGMYFFSHPILILLDLKLVKDIMIKDFANFDERGIFCNEDNEPISEHLVTLNGEKWRKLRAKFTPSFTSGKMKFMFPTIVEVGERFRDCLFEETLQHNELDMGDFCARFTMDVIGTCVFGIECNTLKEENAEFKHYGRKAMERMHAFIFKYILFSALKKVVKFLHLKTISSDITAFFMKVVRETVDYRERNNISRKDFMDIMIKLKNKKQDLDSDDKEEALQFNELAAQSYVFFVAGFDTSSKTLTFCLRELAQHPEIQTKARCLIQEAYKKYDRQYTYEMMMELPYIEQILCETLRKHTPITFTLRKAKEDYRIAETTTIIEKGKIVIIPIHAIHHDPEYYPNPDKFDPERFNCAEKLKRDAIAWLPFGDGPRNCIGKRFGMMQTRIGLIMLLNNFVFSIKSKIRGPDTKSLPENIIVKPLDNLLG